MAVPVDFHRNVTGYYCVRCGFLVYGWKPSLAMFPVIIRPLRFFQIIIYQAFAPAGMLKEKSINYELWLLAIGHKVPIIIYNL